MNREEFQRLAEGRILYLDGATGSNLLKRGMPGGVCPEQWVLQHKDVMLGLQREYVDAGSNIIYAPTFTANRLKLREYRLDQEIGRMNRELVSLSGEAAAGRAYVAGDLTMTGRQLKPLGPLDFEELVDIYKEQIGYLAEGGADLLVVETMMSLQECRAALIAAKETCGLPVLVTMTFETDGRGLYGTDAVTAAVVLSRLGAAAVGVNCSAGPDRMEEWIRAMAAVTDIPIIAKPNAGLPSLDEEGNTIYDMPADVFAEETVKLVAAGAGIIGGCCGTTPEYIARLRQAVEAGGAVCPAQAYGPAGPAQARGADSPAWVSGSGIGKPEGPRGDGRARSGSACTRQACIRRYLASERRTLSFGLSDALIVVGERINPTGKKKLQAELKEGSLNLVRRFAEEQEENGAGVLDINMGMGGIDEKDRMLQAIEEVTQVSPLPLAIDTSNPDVMEAALRRYPGRALMNSISLEKGKCEALLPVAKKYGAMFILLPLSDAGLPKDLDEKKQIINTIVEKALAEGLCKEDIVVDGLVTTVGANQEAALETLETIRYCREQGLATICGLSNISFGLPERGFVNAAFLTMAIQAGLTMAIANPGQQLLMDCVYASDLLLHREGADIRYINRMNARKEQAAGNEDTPALTAPGVPKAAGTGGGEAACKNSAAAAAGRVREAVIKGDRRRAAGLAREAVEAGIAPKSLLDGSLLPAINEVGELFDKGIYFLPQLIASAEAMKLAIEYLEPLLGEGREQGEMPVIVIATVQGDIHDIGKNLVALMFRNYGFQVIDLGKDVPRERIIEAAKEHQAGIIALSALMTTTMQEMRRVIEYKKEQGVDAYVMVGGAVITQDYADEIGADGYSADAAEAVRVARRLLGLS